MNVSFITTDYMINCEATLMSIMADVFEDIKRQGYGTSDALRVIEASLVDYSRPYSIICFDAFKKMVIRRKDNKKAIKDFDRMIQNHPNTILSTTPAWRVQQNKEMIRLVTK